jgi:hypothetical protein
MRCATATPSAVAACALAPTRALATGIAQRDANDDVFVCLFIRLYLLIRCNRYLGRVTLK